MLAFPEGYFFMRRSRAPRWSDVCLVFCLFWFGRWGGMEGGMYLSD